MNETIAELLQNIEEAYDRFRKLLEDPDLDWDRDLGDRSTVGSVVAHVLNGDSWAVSELAKATVADPVDVEEFDLDGAQQALGDYARVRDDLAPMLARVTPDNVFVESTRWYGNVLGILTYSAHHTNMHWFQIRGL